MLRCIAPTLVAVLLLQGGTSGQDRAALEKAIHVQNLMTTEVFKRCGLSKLSNTELKRLDAWLLNYTMTVLDATSASFSPAQRRQSTRDSLTLSKLEGAVIIADDGEFLGIITRNCFDSKSLCNKFGEHGNKFNSTSIFNKFGTYGSEFSSLSPFNQFTSTPPRVSLDGQFVAYLTKNSSLSPRIDPHVLIGWLSANE